MFEHIISRLEGRRQARWGYSAKCPAHEDRRQSLTVRIGDSGDLWLRCHAGCTFESIIQALGVTKQECFAEPRTVSKEVASYDYRDEQGNLLFQAVRFEPKEFRQRKPSGEWGIAGVRRVLYRLDELTKAPRRTVLLVEGEKDADRLVKEGFLATCNPMGAGKWCDEYSQQLAGRSVVILPDNDKVGIDHALNVYRELRCKAKAVVVLKLDGLPDKGDVSDWLNAGNSADTLKTLARDALRVEEISGSCLELPARARLKIARRILASIELP